MVKLCKNINWRLYLALVSAGLFPALYTSLRFFYLNDLPNDSSLSIGAQIQWLELLIEVFQEFLIVPFFFLFGQMLPNPQRLAMRAKASYLIIGGFYLLLALFIIFNAPQLLLSMESRSFLAEATAYIRWETLAFIFVVLTQLNAVLLVLLKKEKSIYILLVIQMAMLIVGDTLLLSSLPFSLQMGVLGIAFSNLIGNAAVFGAGLYLINKELNLISVHPDWTLIRDILKIGTPAGLESLGRNLIYAFMIVKMVNMVSKQGVYWQVTTFFWVWLLLPVLKLGELIKRDSGENPATIHSHHRDYLLLTTTVVALWSLCIPFYGWFLKNALNVKEVEEAVSTTLLLLPFYAAFAYGNIWASYFYGLGKTTYLLWNTLITNCAYYGLFFFLYKLNYFIPTLESIALMFGGGMVVTSFISFLFFKSLRKRIGKCSKPGGLFNLYSNISVIKKIGL